MKAVEFETTVNNHGQILLPADLAVIVPSGEPVRVVLDVGYLIRRCGMARRWPSEI